jgi:hypothetical protein
LSGVTVTLEIGAMLKTSPTDADGLASFLVKGAELEAASPPGAVVIRAKKHHHGPDPGPEQAVTPGEATLSVTADLSGYDPSTPGLASDSVGALLDIVLIDGGLRFAATSSEVTRRLDEGEVQRELMARYLSGDVTLRADSDFEFDHDPSLGEFDACDPGKCKLKRPMVDRWVNLR